MKIEEVVDVSREVVQCVPHQWKNLVGSMGRHSAKSTVTGTASGIDLVHLSWSEYPMHLALSVKMTVSSSSCMFAVGMSSRHNVLVP